MLFNLRWTHGTRETRYHKSKEAIKDPCGHVNGPNNKERGSQMDNVRIRKNQWIQSKFHMVQSTTIIFGGCYDTNSFFLKLQKRNND